MGVIKNLSGTSENTFKIGITGNLIRTGTNNPNSSSVAGADDDVYIGSGRVFQKTSSDWKELLDSSGGQTLAGTLTVGSSGRIALGSGTAAAPLLRFTSAISTGFYLADTDTLGIAAGGLAAIEITPSTTYIKGDLYVQGTHTWIHSQDLEVEDNIILINNQESGSGVSLGTAGIAIKRGTLPTVSWLFDESNDSFRPDNTTKFSNIDSITTPAGKLEVVGTGSLKIPTGTTGQRPGTPGIAEIRHNSTINTVEFWDGAVWFPLGGTGGGSYLPLGGGTMTGDIVMSSGGRLQLTNGSASDPSLTFASDLDTGLYRIAGNTLGMTAGGTLALTVAQSGASTTLPFNFADGNAAGPAMTFSSDPDTGIYHSASNELGIAANGLSVIRVNATSTIFNQTGSLVLPNGTTANRLNTTTGEIRFNTDTASSEVRFTTGWVSIGSPTTGSIVLGDSSHTVTSNYGRIFGGVNASAYLYGQRASANGRFAANGDAQASQVVARNTTTNATPTVLFLDGTSQKIVIPAGSTWSFLARIVGRRTDNSGATNAIYKIEGAVTNNGGTTALIGTSMKTIFAESGTAWDADVVSNDTTDSIDVQVTGESGATIRWVAEVNLVEVRS